VKSITTKVERFILGKDDYTTRHGERSATLQTSPSCFILRTTLCGNRFPSTILEMYSNKIATHCPKPTPKPDSGTSYIHYKRALWLHPARCPHDGKPVVAFVSRYSNLSEGRGCFKQHLNSWMYGDNKKYVFPNSSSSSPDDWLHGNLNPSLIYSRYIAIIGRSRWPSGLRRHELSSLALTLGSWVRVPLKAWMSVLCAVYSVCR
jgi:hypothetical protein